MEDIHGGGCKEFRVFGPPGTGKTTWLVKQVRRAAEKYGGEKVLCCSFTKTAATEMVNRITPPDDLQAAFLRMRSLRNVSSSIPQLRAYITDLSEVC